VTANRHSYLGDFSIKINLGVGHPSYGFDPIVIASTPGNYEWFSMSVFIRKNKSQSDSGDGTMIRQKAKELNVMSVPKIMGLPSWDPTTWLKMVWSALDERDAFKRTRMLENANTLRQDSSRSCDPQQEAISKCLYRVKPVA
jgi:hypothetical protein